MNEPATQVLIDRAREPDGLSRMLVFSALAHGLLIAVVLLVPADWRAGPVEDPLRSVMTISLAGAPGPRAGGMTPMGGRPIQQVVPLPEVKRPEPVRPPAERTPAMTVPQPTARRRAAPSTPVTSAPDEARGRTPATGPEASPGSTMADTGGRGMGFGLSTGGGGGTGGYLEVGDFCCPEYLSTMLDLIRRNWNSNQQVSGEAMIKFTIQRDGRLTDVEVERSSGYVALDLSAQRALALTRLPPLPSAFGEPHLTVHLNFQYQR